MRTLSVWGAIALLLGGFAGANKNKASVQDSQEIAALRAAWARTLHDKQIEAAMNLYTDDAIFFSPDVNNAIGKAQIRSLYEKVTKAFTSSIEFEAMSLWVSGDLAYESGNYRETLTNAATGAKSNLHGSYLMILERTAGGKFRISQHMWTNAPSDDKPSR